MESIKKALKRMFDCGSIDNNTKHRIRKADIFFLLGIVIAALVIFILMRLNSKAGSYATVSYDGSGPLARILLEQSEPRYFLITYQDNKTVSGDKVDIVEFSEKEWEEVFEKMQLTDVEYNVFLYKDQEISMLYGSCPDKICVRHKPISMKGENIICLPHKLVIDIVDDKNSGLDGVAY